MPSLLSRLFSKRSKRRSSSPSRQARERAFPLPKVNEQTDDSDSASDQPLPAVSARPATIKRSRSVLRPFALDHRSSSTPAPAANRTNSYKAPQRRGSKRAASFPAPHSPPRLDVDLGRAITGEVEQGGLGLDQLGKWPRLSETEVKQQEAREISLEDLQNFWEIARPALRRCDFSRPGLDRISDGAGDVDYQRYVLALFLATLEHTNHFKPLPSAAFRNHSSSSLGERPGQQLRHLFAESQQVTLDLLSSLIWALRHVRDRRCPILSIAAYEALEGAEGQSSTAYAAVFAARLDETTCRLLGDVFELCSSIAAHGQENGLPDTRICYVLGYWLFAQRTRESEWTEEQRKWEEAGKKLERVFLAWLKNEATMKPLPGRLLKLIDSHTSDPSHTHTAHLTPATPTKTILHVSITKKGIGSSPALGDSDALRILRDVDESNIRTVAPVLSSIMDQLSLTSRSTQDTLPTLPHSATTTAAEDSPLTPRTFLTDKLVHSPSSSPTVETIDSLRADQAKRRSHSYGDFAPATLPRSNTSAAHLPNVSSTFDRREMPTFGQTVSSGLATKRYSTWDEISEFGFGDVSSDIATLDVPRRRTEGSFSRQVTTRHTSRPVVPQTLTHSNLVASTEATYQAENETLQQVDPLFLSFLRFRVPNYGGLGDQSLILQSFEQPGRLVYHHSDRIDALLFSVTQPPAPAPVSVPVRPISPSSRSTSIRLHSSFSIRGLLDRSKSSRALNPYQAAAARDMPSPRPGIQTLFSQPSETHSLAPPLLSIRAASDSGVISNTGLAVDDKASGHSTRDPSETTAEGVDVLTLVPEEWFYLSEGGQNVLFDTRSTEERFKGKLLRVRKGKALSPTEEAVLEYWRHQTVPALLPDGLLPQREVVKISLKFMAKIWSKAQEKRPAERLDGTDLLFGTMTSSYLRAELVDNVMRHPEAQHIIAIEIKPKWGFLPDSSEIFELNPEQNLARRTVSRYRAHQELRGSKATYEPLDLFSEDSGNRSRALQCLWADWEHPNVISNNLFISVDGRRVRPSDRQHAWLNEDAFRRDVLLPSVLQILSDSRVLPFLKRLQRAPDISLIAHELQTQQGSAVATDHDDPFRAYNFGAMTRADLELSNGNTSNLRRMIVQLSKAMVFRDCSIIISIPYSATNGDVGLDAEKAITRVIDLDLKDTQDKLKKWFELDKAIWQHHSSQRVTAKAPPIEHLPVSRDSCETTIQQSLPSAA